MKTNIIEITVRGSCGTGKSEVAEVIANALNDFYNPGNNMVKVSGDTCVGAIEEAKTTGQTAKRKETIFVLREEMPSE